MSNYTKIQNWASLVDTDIIGAPFDTEFAAVAAASATKSNKKIPAAPNNLASLSSAGDLQDSGLLTSAMADAVAFHYTTGDVKLTAIDSEPTGWLYCDGSSLSTSTYADLFSAIGYTYGGSGPSFNAPDLRGRVAAGLDNLGGTSANTIVDADADSLGGTFGTETITLSEAQMPAHTHVLSMDTYAGHEQVAEDLVAGVGIEVAVGLDHGMEDGAGAHTHEGTALSTGGDTAHNNVQPSIAMNYLIKT
jgi:microcystin-dependent protein